MINDFLVGLGLFFVLEGLFYGVFPSLAKRFARDVSELPDTILQAAGVLSIAIGVALVWLVRG